MANHVLSPKIVRELLNRKNLAPRKSLGQNFLIDANIQQKIVAAAEILPRDLVLEIGPGLGALTESLLERAGQVIAVEYDRGLFAVLQENFSSQPRIQLLNQDFLGTDLVRLLEVYRKEEYHYKVVANLPYYITTPVIFKLLESGISWESMVFMVQKEVADRICATPGSKDYGSLTVMLNFYGRSEKVCNAPKTVFYPVPQVDSVVVKITTHVYAGEEAVRQREMAPFLQQVVQTAFGQRRKTILNALTSLALTPGPRDSNKEDWASRLHKLGISPMRRGETLSLQEFVDITNEFYLWSKTKGPGV